MLNFYANDSTLSRFRNFDATKIPQITSEATAVESLPFVFERVVAKQLARIIHEHENFPANAQHFAREQLQTFWPFRKHHRNEAAGVGIVKLQAVVQKPADHVQPLPDRHRPVVVPLPSHRRELPPLVGDRVVRGARARALKTARNDDAVTVDCARGADGVLPHVLALRHLLRLRVEDLHPALVAVHPAENDDLPHEGASTELFVFNLDAQDLPPPVKILFY